MQHIVGGSDLLVVCGLETRLLVLEVFAWVLQDVRYYAHGGKEASNMFL